MSKTVVLVLSDVEDSVVLVLLDVIVKDSVVMVLLDPRFSWYCQMLMAVLSCYC